MLKTATTFLVVLSILLLSTPHTVLPQSTAVPENELAAKREANTNTADLKQVFSNETERLKAGSTFDPVKADRDRAKQQTGKKGWSTTKKTLVIAAIAVGIAAILFIGIKYGKDCLRSSPPNCTPGVDENCVCEEYERRIPQQE
jgi:hypothetical protein